MSVFGRNRTARPFTPGPQREFKKEVLGLKSVSPEGLTKAVNNSGLAAGDWKNKKINRNFQVGCVSPEIRGLKGCKMRSFAKSDKGLRKSKEKGNKGLEIFYSDFKKYHFSNVQKRLGVMSRQSVLKYPARLKKPVIEVIKQEEVEKEDIYIKMLQYEKPAMTYQEKLVRLSQFSIFT